MLKCYALSVCNSQTLSNDTPWLTLTYLMSNQISFLMHLHLKTLKSCFSKTLIAKIIILGRYVKPNKTIICLVGLMLNVPVNSYGHVGTSVHLTTFIPGHASLRG